MVEHGEGTAVRTHLPACAEDHAAVGQDCDLSRGRGDADWLAQQRTGIGVEPLPDREAVRFPDPAPDQNRFSVGAERRRDEPFFTVGGGVREPQLPRRALVQCDNLSAGVGGKQKAAAVWAEGGITYVRQLRNGRPDGKSRRRIPDLNKVGKRPPQVARWMRTRR